MKDGVKDMTFQLSARLVTLTKREQTAVYAVLDAVLEKMAYDPEMKSFVDNGDVVITLDKEEFQAAKRAHKKMLGAF